MTPICVRQATGDDIPALGGIERAAGEMFREVGMPEIADDDPLPEDELAAGVAAGRLWVAVDGGPIAYLLAMRLGAGAHIEQVTVAPSHARRGIGARLVAACVAWAEACGADAVTLTTFRDVPWNGPYYERLGFRVVPDEAVGEEIRALVEAERRAGLHRWPRVVMAYRGGDEDRCSQGGP